MSSIARTEYRDGQDVPSTTPFGQARRVNRTILTVTLAFSACAMTWLSAMALLVNDQENVLPVLVYGSSLVLCALCSFLYHTSEDVRYKKLLRRLDHSAIFLFIAGTYTPFAFNGIAGPFGLPLLEWVWGLAIAGIWLKVFLGEAYDRLFVLVYLALGWLFVASFDQILNTLTPASFMYLLVGGVAFTLGALIYLRDIGHWTDPVWHGFVLAGSITHFLAVLALRTTDRPV
jgi:hemolysin III